MAEVNTRKAYREEQEKRNEQRVNVKPNVLRLKKPMRGRDGENPK